MKTTESAFPLTKTDIPLFALGDIPAAIGLLSRLPVRVDTDAAQTRGAHAAWAYPVAGLVVGVIAAIIGTLGLWFNLPSRVVAGLCIGCLVVITGALHEDGLADAADGLWGAWTVDRRLEIMKDSRIGAYGVIALVLGLGLRWMALAALIDVGALWPACVIAGVVSRTPMTALMALVPHARDTGLSRSVGTPPRTTAAVAAGIGALTAVLFGGTIFLCLLLVIPLVAYAVALIAKAKINGQTGDILGACQQLSEIATLLCLCAVLT